MDKWILFIQQPHWLIKILIGIVLGALLPQAGKMTILLISRLKKNSLLGKWYKYHVSYREGASQLFETEWIIKRGFFKPYKVIYKYDGRTLLYNGSMEFERGHLLFILRALSHPETVICRTTYPLPLANSSLSGKPTSPTQAQNKNAYRDSYMMYGIWMSYDHDIQIASGATLMCREPIEDKDEALRKLKNRFHVEGEKPSIRLTFARAKSTTTAQQIAP